ncbi:pentatricopeptide repeat-containing protein At3g26630, chloroplastic-like [Carica papaya]|uniref:pentatricopeptide repeat-containing protein At3g26630, chloroplastic-like n=1 Tax=Carica papaya TaxID=3649 RepID=UPI000B8C932E|nr:pentatricopeptide repeat-containing protein At3g26630, chloroplastic-like [Carica papaya]
MLACLPCYHDPLPWKSPSRIACSASRLLFDSQEALLWFQKCSSCSHLKQIHAKIIRHGLFHDQLLVRKLLHLCSSYGKMDYATLVFHQLHQPSTFSWNLMIRAFTTNAKPLQALLFYNLMICQSFQPDKFSFPFVLKACVALSNLNKGKEVHALAIKTGLFRDTFLQNTLMDLYFKSGDLDSGFKVFQKMRVTNVVSWTTVITGLLACGELGAARQTFEQMPVRNVVSWTVMIGGYVRNQDPQEAFELFQRMLLNNVRPNEFTLVSLLKACAELGSLDLGRWIHDFALKNGFKLGVYLGTALVDMYSKCGSLQDAKQVFEKMERKSLATWNAMITSLGIHGCGKEALDLFAQMERANEKPDAITFVGVLSACVHINDVDEGFRYYRYMIEHHGIEPILEHYTCMLELCNRASMPDGDYRPMNSLRSKLKETVANAEDL